MGFIPSMLVIFPSSYNIALVVSMHMLHALCAYLPVCNVFQFLEFCGLEQSCVGRLGAPREVPI